MVAQVHHAAAHPLPQALLAAPQDRAHHLAHARRLLHPVQALRRTTPPQTFLSKRMHAHTSQQRFGEETLRSADEGISEHCTALHVNKDGACSTGGVLGNGNGVHRDKLGREQMAGVGFLGSHLARVDQAVGVALAQQVALRQAPQLEHLRSRVAEHVSTAAWGKKPAVL